jgi:peroxiredoxin (alkyl hydroperoxide reductase subunit C)
MSYDAEKERGPSFGEPAPDFEAIISGHTIKLRDFKGKWVVIFSHPEDLLSVFRTRTIKYLLCKRRTKVIALGEGQTEGIDIEKNLLRKYVLKHNLMVVDDSAGGIAESYGLSRENHEGRDEEKGVFIVDPKGILRVKLYLPLHAERNFYEILKLIDALQTTDRQRMTRIDKGTWRRRLDMAIRKRVIPEEGQAG